MTTNTSVTLERLSDTDLDIAEPRQDIRNREVQDASGKKIGKVDDLFIDPIERRVRFVEVASGGFLGIGESKHLIPVESIRSVTKDVVHIGYGGEHVAGAPKYDPTLLDSDLVNRTYSYYGYSPYWTPGYSYPERWYL